MAALIGLTWASIASGADVSVSGATTLVGLQVLEGRERLRVSGILQDDARQPVARLPLQVALPGLLAELRFFSCAAAPQQHAADSQLEMGAPLETDGERNTALIETDRLGRFCVGVDKEAVGKQLTVHFAGSQHLLPTDAAVSLAPKPNQVLLRFAASELRLALNHAPLVVRVDTAAAQPAAPHPITVTLWRTDTQVPQQLGDAVSTVVGQAAFFAVSAKQLGNPGAGELRARFDGDHQSNAYETIAKLIKIGSVTLALQGQPIALQSGGWSFGVIANSSPVAPIAGLVEARHRGVTLAIASLTSGRATLSLESGIARTPDITVSFVGAEPWWVGESALRITLPAAPQTASRNGAWWLASLLLVAFFVWRAWQGPGIDRPRRAKTMPVKGPQAVIVLADTGTQQAWSGRVLDADDEQPVAGASVQVSTASFAESRVIAQTSSDRDGHFAFPVLDPKAGPVTLRVSADEHRPVEQRLERPSQLVVRLKLRRRALISELVNWALLRGAPRSGSDPTPGQIARHAGAQGREAARSWAHSIEEAAFGRSPVDEHRDMALFKRRPDPARDD